MGKNTAWGQKAYKETMKSTGSKSESKAAQQSANESYSSHIGEQQARGSGSKSFDESVHDFNHSKNDGAMHTSEDL